MQIREPINILLVDDRPDGLLTMEAVLKSPDYTLIKASSGPEALVQVQREDFAVILLDVQMPGMDGFQTAAKIKETARSKDTPIIFVTAINKDPFYIYQGYTVGAVDYLFKPFDPKILQSKVAVFVSLFRQHIHIKRQTEEIRNKETELFQARKLEAIGRLAGGVAHDFNNLLTGILGLSHDIRNTFGDHDARREDLDEIIKAGSRAMTLTKQLLAFGRRQISSPKILDLNVLITDMTKMLKRLIGEDIELRTELGPDLYTVKLEQSHLEQIILNLVLNSRDAMPHGGSISISTGNVQIPKGKKDSGESVVPGPYVLLHVTDTGCGMDALTLAHIFEPYFTTKEKDQGTGLGLATVYGVIKQYGGHVEVKSAPGSGTTFSIYLPHVPGILETSDREEPIPAHAQGGHETILVVEDEDIVRRVTKRALTTSGYTVFAARDAKEALEFVDRYGQTIDLLLTDVVMPGMNGRQLAESITQKRSGIAVLYMSGYSEDVVQTRFDVDSRIDFIEKTFSTQKLTQKVREVIDAHKASQEKISVP
jgi:two-component system cell cycle sensor histidine kinase/response regulator CckA